MAKLKLKHPWMAPHKVVFADGRSVTFTADETEVTAADAIATVKKHPDLFITTNQKVVDVPLEEKVAESEAEQPVE